MPNLKRRIPAQKPVLIREMFPKSFFLRIGLLAYWLSLILPSPKCLLPLEFGGWVRMCHGRTCWPHYFHEALVLMCSRQFLRFKVLRLESEVAAFPALPCSNYLSSSAPSVSS
jgi:hypothetical protein